MGKITVKHYLNTKAKPVFINGEKHYKIKVLITVMRKTSNADSLNFSDYYTDLKYNEIMKREKKNVENEKETIQNIIKTQLEIFENDFDFALFHAFYRTMPKHEIVKFNVTKEIYFLFGNMKNIYAEILKRINAPNGNFRYMELFSPENQEIMLKQDFKNNTESLRKINKAVFYFFFDTIFRNIATLTEKYKPLLKYNLTTEKAYEIIEKA